MSDLLYDAVPVGIALALLAGLIFIFRSRRSQPAEWMGDQRLLCAECDHGFWRSEAHKTESGALCCSRNCCFLREVEEAIQRPV